MVDKDFCYACGARAVRKAFAIPSLISNVLYVTKTLYKNVQSALSDDSLNHLIILYNDLIT